MVYRVNEKAMAAQRALAVERLPAQRALAVEITQRIKRKKKSSKDLAAKIYASQEEYPLDQTKPTPLAITSIAAYLSSYRNHFAVLSTRKNRTAYAILRRMLYLLDFKPADQLLEEFREHHPNLGYSNGVVHSLEDML